jgi:CrcB protein
MATAAATCARPSIPKITLTSTTGKSMNSIFLIAAGGAIGSVARYLMSIGIDRWLAINFPFGTLAVNIIGSFTIGLVAGLTDDKSLREFIMIGILGGFTTFSSFSLQTCNLAEGDRWGAASLYIMISIMCCLLATYAGQLVAHRLPIK